MDCDLDGDGVIEREAFPTSSHSIVYSIVPGGVSHQQHTESPAISLSCNLNARSWWQCSVETLL